MPAGPFITWPHRPSSRVPRTGPGHASRSDRVHPYVAGDVAVRRQQAELERAANNSAQLVLLHMPDTCGSARSPGVVSPTSSPLARVRRLRGNRAGGWVRCRPPRSRSPRPASDGPRPGGPRWLTAAEAASRPPPAGTPVRPRRQAGAGPDDPTGARLGGGGRTVRARPTGGPRAGTGRAEHTRSPSSSNGRSPPLGVRAENDRPGCLGHGFLAGHCLRLSRFRRASALKRAGRGSGCATRARCTPPSPRQGRHSAMRSRRRRGPRGGR